MCGGGKGTQTTSQQLAAPNPAAMAAYNQAMGRVNEATSIPFQRYSSDPTAYVSPMTQTQTEAIGNISGMAGMTDPYYQAATGLTAAGAGPVGRLTGEQIGEYMSPYMSQVVDPVKAAMEQQFGRQLSQQQAQAIKAGAFGGERAGVERALLRGQQGLALGSALSPLYQQGYGQALQTAQGQQAIEAQNLQRMLGAGQQFGGLGSAAQQAALQQAQAQLQGGTLEQQTRNAMLQALYGEAQKERMYPLQAAQIQAQAAGAIGPLMGSYQQTMQPQPFFGGLASGGAVDAYGEGLGRARMGGAVIDLEPGKDYSRGGYAVGGIGSHLSYVDPTDPSAMDRRKMDILLSSQRASLAPDGEDIQVPIMHMPPGRPPEISAPPARREPGLVSKAISSYAEDPERLGKAYESGKEALGKAKDIFGFLSGSSSPFASSYADGGGVDPEDAAMQSILNSPIKTSEPLKPQEAPQKEKGGLGSLIKTGASMAANYFLPGSGAAVSTGLGALGMAHGGRAGYADRGSVDDDGFESAYQRTLKFEGGLNPSDTNRTPSMRGINQAAHPGIDVTKLTEPQTRDIYRNEYWGGIGASKLPPAIREMAYDTAILAGPGKAKQLIERSGGDPEVFMNQRRDFLNSLLARNPEKYGKYAKAWESRNQALEGGLGGVDAAREGIAGIRREIPPGDPRREMMASSDEPRKSEGLGGDWSSESGFLERTQRHPESLILPVLSGLGAMAGSRSRYLGSAILEGLGAGAKSYMDVAEKIPEVQKKYEDVGYQRALTRERENLADRQKAETENVIAGLYERQLVPGVGTFVYDKRNPYKAPVKIMDGMGRPIPGQEHIVQAFGESAVPGGEPGAGAGQPTHGGAKPEMGGIPAGGKPFEWAPTTQVTESDMPDTQFQLMQPGQAERNQAQGLDTVTEYNKSAKAATNQLMRINEMEHVVKSLNEGNEEFLKTGSWGDARLNIAKNINELVRTLGGQEPFNPNMVSSAEILKKNAFRLGAEAGAALGSNEAARIIESSVGATPGLENTKEGYIRLLAGLKMAAQYQTDKSKFIENFYKRFLHTQGAASLFDEKNPVENYVRRAVASTIDPRALADLKRAKPEDLTILRPLVDKKYGTGTTNLLLGIGE